MSRIALLASALAVACPLALPLPAGAQSEPSSEASATRWNVHPYPPRSDSALLRFDL